MADKIISLTIAQKVLVVLFMGLLIFLSELLQFNEQLKELVYTLSVLHISLMVYLIFCDMYEDSRKGTTEYDTENGDGESCNQLL